MELWIRSQNKEVLLKVTGLNLYNNCREADEWSIESGDFILGKYKKERALGLLDMIEHWIAQTNENKKQVIIYEMPEE